MLSKSLYLIAALAVIGLVTHQQSPTSPEPVPETDVLLLLDSLLVYVSDLSDPIDPEILQQIEVLYGFV